MKFMDVEWWSRVLIDSVSRCVPEATASTTFHPRVDVAIRFQISAGDPWIEARLSSPIMWLVLDTGLAVGPLFFAENRVPTALDWEVDLEMMEDIATVCCNFLQGKVVEYKWLWRRGLKVESGPGEYWRFS
ncbi:hypothetical protein IPV09_03795 [Tessaracoccus sp. SD287]|uniref:hypothetical protein n=1 Tax=Tessaracoccus sp. SD287 TaxID=2782008 RepID=UPI001A9581B1|nr:hypothetical protein [Tessaracoccus sp. SD287]MBO1030453.1 hypothetical protein [Tessaracoccus sp. SD287]